jgi:hypothetical protein
MCLFVTDGTVTVVNPQFDSETGLREFRLRFTTNDHLHTSEERELTVYVTDVNEPPECWPEDYHLTVPEKTVIVFFFHIPFSIYLITFLCKTFSVAYANAISYLPQRHRS